MKFHIWGQEKSRNLRLNSYNQEKFRKFKKCKNMEAKDCQRELDKSSTETLSEYSHLEDSPVQYMVVPGLQYQHNLPGQRYYQRYHLWPSINYLSESGQHLFLAHQGTGWMAWRKQYITEFSDIIICSFHIANTTWRVLSQCLNFKREGTGVNTSECKTRQPPSPG